MALVMNHPHPRAATPRSCASTLVVASPFLWMVLLSLMPPERAGQGAVSLVFDLAAIQRQLRRGADRDADAALPVEWRRSSAR